MAQTNGRIIVIVDDEAMVSRYYSLVFSKFFAVETANTCEEALIKAKLFEPQCVLVDYMLPDCNGVALAVRVLDILPKVLIYVMSGKPLEADDFETCNRLNFEILLKPFDAPALVEKMKLRVSN